MLRPAGESLRLKIDEISEKLNDWLFLSIATPVGLAFAIIVSSSNASLQSRAALAAFIGGFAFALFPARLWKLATELRNHRLGFHGERAVGEEINQLMREGCRVFHDVPMEPYGNIDHVIVAPSGVWAVETKTRRKRKAPPGKKSHEVIYDGRALEYPHCQDTHGLEQAKQQADRLRAMLTKSVGEPVKVAPILTLPGWFVTSRVNDGIKVVNPKAIGAVVLNGRPPALAPQFMERIAYQLDQKCRDVEL